MSTNEQKPEKKPAYTQEEIENAKKELTLLLLDFEKRYDIALRVLLSFPLRVDKFVATVINDGKTITTTYEFYKGDLKVVPTEFLPTEISEKDKDAKIAELKAKNKVLAEALKIAVNTV
jgi:hypothetical protein